MRLAFKLTFGFSSATTRATKFTSLVLREIPAGSTVVVSCKGKGCPKRLTKKHAKGTISLKSMIKKPLRVGVVLKVVVSKPGAITATKTITIRKKKAPVLKST